ncbi:AAA family ATPase [Taurinivorans muris]|uniref:AAA family ATPase n=1 Tax=Taurinivorans muris TaxID=2787751 RepID=A0ABY5Y0Y6_9BACT|nr:AAA family ATPase [Desulfovibrionaceae bacterium LT0009]
MSTNTSVQEFNSLSEIAQHYRDILEKKKYIICFAHNGTGKTRLSMEFKNIGKQLNQNQPEELQRDTLYFNAFTEDLFVWDNDLENDNQRVLRLNSQSKFFNGLHELPMEEKIQFFLRELADFDFKIDYNNSQVSFYREFSETMIEENIKISRGEENIFKWCFFLAIVQLALDGEQAYRWVKYIYIDDPISSLDEHNSINVAYQINKIMTHQERIRFIISTHHSLFFNVISHFFKKSNEVAKLYLHYKKSKKIFKIVNIEGTPFFHHIALLAGLDSAIREDKLYTYHFNTLRTLLEKTASFHGYTEFGDCIIVDEDSERDKERKKVIYSRLLHSMSHGGHSLFEPVEMVDDNKQNFKELFYDFLKNYKFNKNTVRKLG